MPIKNLSEVVRLPRLGKIALGTKHPEKGYPQKADHFVFRKDQPGYDTLVKLYGTEAKELRVMIPVEDEESWGSQYYKCYSATYGLICKGDGELAMRMLDTITGNLPDAKSAGHPVTMKEIPCPGPDCPIYKEKKCGEVMNFRFLLPEVPGLGVWQIDTGSKNSILNINSSAALIKRAFGRISMVPLRLTFEPQQVNNPENGKKQTVYILNLRTNVTLSELADEARQSVRHLTGGMSLEQAYDIEVQKDIDELWGDGKPAVVAEPPPPPPQSAPQAPAAEKAPNPQEGQVDHSGDVTMSESSPDRLANGIDLTEVRQLLHDAQWVPVDLNIWLNDKFKPMTFKVTRNSLGDLGKLSRMQAQIFLGALSERRS